MRKRFLLSLLFLPFAFLAAAQSLQSPEQFLGYKLGSRFSWHYKVVNYFRHAASAMPAMMKLEKYGETNEGRELVMACISSAENIANLETIRQNNLRLSGVMSGNADVNIPAIVWLSYNVHGNETSSSEAAMLTLYELLNPNNTRTKEWLQNTVIIIDPCLNPDGRDRYVNWFQSVLGRKPNAAPQSREHSEPWPGGRSNHYNFDLNRDWAWQTQVESRQRIAKMNQWLPHIHVDYHEQGYNEPYYFAPAAEPFHEVITPWQRDLQTMIGRNNAKYFDQQGWLYFTKERFDLFYPSYGDTWPTYNGAIGMTYEQGGHSRGGLAVITEDGDTLTLLDRLTHHYTTGLSTIEIASQNARRIVQEFKKYFDDARNNPPGEFKSYVVKSGSPGNMKALKNLLERNGIEWGYGTGTQQSGVNYFTGKTENFTAVTRGDIVINANQPRANMVKVLFERSSKLSDSATYDITAWGMPYAYGLNTYGVKNYVKAETPPGIVKGDIQLNSNVYAYAIRWDGLNAAQCLGYLLSKGVRVRYAEQPFRVKGKEFGYGTLLVTRAANSAAGSALGKMVSDAANAAGVYAEEIETGFVDKGFDLGSDRVRMMQNPRVAMVTGNGIGSNAAGEIWHFFDQQLQYPITLLNADEINAGTLRSVDVLIMPDGYYRMLNDKQSADMLRNWVSSGGRIVALEGAAAQLARNDFGFKLKGGDDKKDDDKKDEYAMLKRYENRERDYIPNMIPGAIYKVELDNSHPLAFGYSNEYYTLKQDDNVYEFMKDGWNVGYIKKDNYLTGFTGAKVKEKLKDGLLFGVAEMGRGQVVFLADNPLFRSFWENGKLLLCNAVFMVGQ